MPGTRAPLRHDASGRAPRNPTPSSKGPSSAIPGYRRDAMHVVLNATGAAPVLRLQRFRCRGAGGSRAGMAFEESFAARFGTVCVVRRVRSGRQSAVVSRGSFPFRGPPHLCGTPYRGCWCASSHGRCGCRRSRRGTRRGRCGRRRGSNGSRRGGGDTTKLSREQLARAQLVNGADALVNLLEQRCRVQVDQLTLVQHVTQDLHTDGQRERDRVSDGATGRGRAADGSAGGGQRAASGRRHGFGGQRHAPSPAC
jgi:hypothetical protein